MSLRIYYNPASQHARRVRMAGIELGLEIDWKLLDFATGDNRQPEYLKLNPNGKVPTLQEDGFVLWESNSIMAYLADKKPQAGLYPTNPQERADVNRWLFWESAHFGPAAIALTWERVMKPAFLKQEPIPALVEEGEQNLARFSAVLNGNLETRQYVTGSLSIADFALASILTYRTHARMDLEPYRHLRAWLERIESRDSWKQTPPPF